MSVRAYEAWVGPLQAHEKERSGRRPAPSASAWASAARSTPDHWADLVAWFEASSRPVARSS